MFKSLFFMLILGNMQVKETKDKKIGYTILRFGSPINEVLFYTYVYSLGRRCLRSRFLAQGIAYTATMHAQSYVLAFV